MIAHLRIPVAKHTLHNRRGHERNALRTQSPRAKSLALLVCTATMLVSLAGLADGQNNASVAGGSTAKVANEQIQSTDGPIFPAESLTGATVRTTDDEDAGMIKDLVWDLDTGHLAFVVLATGNTATADKGQLALPVRAFQNLAAAHELTVKVPGNELKSAPRLAEDDNSLTRRQATAIFEHFRLAPDWKDRQRIYDSDQLVRASQLQNEDVLNGEGKVLGHIKDFAITAHGQVAYVAVARADDKLYPVPLSGFVVRRDDLKWVLELPKDIFDETPAFAATNWPKALDRGWLEYVHVRYGRSVFDGVNRERRGDKAQAR
jgi:sporulation protein YlmC with PRC-barrel domain